MFRTVFAFMSMALCVISAAAMDERHAVPDAAPQEQATKLIRDLFKKEFAKKSPRDKLTLAVKLLGQAMETKDDPASRFVLMREARDLAVQGGDPVMMLAIIDNMAQEYAIDSLAMKLVALETIKPGTLPVAGKKLIETITPIVDDALVADEFNIAAKLLGLAENIAKSTRNNAQLPSLQARIKVVESLRKDYANVGPAAVVLKDNPKDQTANLTMGKYLCFAKGNWEQGLPMLLLGDDAKLRGVAENDLTNPSNATDQVTLADAWWNLADGEKNYTKMGMWKRAYYWYKLAAPELAGLAKTKAEKRIDELLKHVPNVGDVVVGSQPKPGKERIFDVGNGVKITFCWIPASNGKFKIGSPKSEQDYIVKTYFGGNRRDLDDENEYEVGGVDGFWIAKTEMTQAQYVKLTGKKNPSYFCADGVGKDEVKGKNTNDFPVEEVSWDDAQDCIKGMKVPPGAKRIALPSEAQWEWACRGGRGNGRAFYFGSILNGDKANSIGENPYGTTIKGPYLKRTEMIGSYESKAPHPWGVNDMHGNVIEWCEDYFGPYEKLPPGKNPVQTVRQSNDGHVLRGGSWKSISCDCRSARRFKYAPDGGTVGFRVCLRLD